LEAAALLPGAGPAADDRVVVIERTGVEILTEGVPLELGETEALMQGEGILQAFPPTVKEE
jgi:hypothetical protein